MTIRVRLYRPSDLFGRLICWRLESQWSHATIEFDGTIYSATFPHILMCGPNDAAFGMPPRTGRAIEVRMSDDERARALAYCQSMLGTSYDVLAIAGWALRIEAMQRPHHAYCFEYVADALAAAGVFPDSRRLITGDQLLVDLYASGRVLNPDIGQFDQMGARAAAKHQPAPVAVPAPLVRP
ncbi:hypothetical protein [Tanticharoenia sakaeratensis]|uniref:Uncharacterized protein n=1 Tax=Tanticharoenia sakaeratensis NBRC 103193 TaxID=1231623 RepID=A0A0D6MN80_9PROT|nr:hypothetical protein [Tanticharoenia sakaeratensis]GAN54896.1 hypothetical protein Tasa_033_010 [Tanticharoenia sakaeratensis NBRC 103193]GBQ23474.1 hypothetical protein AA103193_2428 [Tanticharoenia sakaeratensis NBRC 103193]